MTYTTADLGPYKKYSYALRLRDGVVYGGRDRPEPGNYNVHAAFWDGGWTMLPDPSPGIVSSVATSGVAGRICGGFTVPGLEEFGRATIWEENGGTWTPIPLPMPVGAIGSWASKISMDGEVIAGELSFAQFDDAAAIWTRNGGSWDVQTLPRPDVRAFATGLPGPDADTVIGDVLDRPRYYPVRWTNSPPWSYVPLPPPNGVSHADVYAGSENTTDGWTAGWISVSDGPARAVRWSPNATQAEDIGAGDDTYATSLHSGRVVGVHDGAGLERAFVWSAQTGVVDIHPSGWDWSYPGDIDAAGRIVMVAGMGTMGNPTTDKSILLLTPA